MTLRLPDDVALPADLVERAELLSQTAGRPTIAYCRESDDRSGTDVRGQLRRQFDRLYRSDLRLVAVFIEVRSAFHEGRPQFAELLRWLADGQAEVVTATRADRISRNRADSHEFGKIAAAHQVLVRTTTDGDFDLSDLRGQEDFDAAILGARRESRIKRDRARDRKEEQWELQIFPGGQRGFGYNVEAKEDGTGNVRVPKLDEFEALGQAASDILDPDSGISPGAVAKRWNLAGLYTTQGYPWTSERVVKTLTRPYVAGLHKFRDGPLEKAPWEAAISRAQWEALCRRFSSPVKGSTEPHKRYTATLLGVSVYRCAECLSGCEQVPAGHVKRLLSGGPNKASSARKMQYRCPCCNLQRTAEPVDAIVLDEALRYLKTHDDTPFDPADPAGEAHLSARVRAIDERLVRLESPATAAVLTAEEISALVRPLRVERRQVEAEIDRVRLAYVARVRDATGPSQFVRWPIERQRRFVDRTFAVTLSRQKRGARFNPDTVTVERRQS